MNDLAGKRSASRRQTIGLCPFLDNIAHLLRLKSINVAQDAYDQPYGEDVGSFSGVAPSSTPNTCKSPPRPLLLVWSSRKHRMQCSLNFAS
jgi:hypothetical protein